MDVPEPSMCPDCRLQRRLLFRNERNLYHNTCGLCNKSIVTINSSDKPYPVYCTTCWWGDSWDPISYGRDFDFDRPFFEQFKELWDSVPKLQFLVLGDNINSDYSQDSYKMVNCYLVFEAEQSKDCYYGETCYQLIDCCDFLCLKSSELCYECVNCTDCYNVDFSRYCNNCADSQFLLNCKGCRSCFGCVNLQNKSYYIFNKSYSKEEYEKLVAQYKLGNSINLEDFKMKIEEFFRKFPQKNLHGIMNENVTGENISNCKDTFECFSCEGLRDCKYCTNMMGGANDCYDVDIWGNKLDLAYNSAGIGDGCQNIVASYYTCIGVKDVYHSIFCMNNNNDLLGCVGLHQKKFCILNKQYSEDEWHEMFRKIKGHMIGTGEWGEFFPPSLSAFGYNETVAQEYFPLTREEALERGFKWKEEDAREYIPQTYAILEDISDVPDGVCQEVLACTDCSKNFKIIPQELKLYRKKSLPIPRKCPDCRHMDRLALRNPRKLWDRGCSACSCAIKTSYSPGRPEKVLCEKCYLEEVY